MLNKLPFGIYQHILPRLSYADATVLLLANPKLLGLAINYKRLIANLPVYYLYLHYDWDPDLVKHIELECEFCFNNFPRKDIAEQFGLMFYLTTTLHRRDFEREICVSNSSPRKILSPANHHHHQSNPM